MPLYPQGGGLYPDSISNDLLADMPANTVKGRAAGTGTGNPTDIPMSSLVAASAGLSYRNILGRNGGFEVWQRGAGGSAFFGVVANTQQYIADGWVVLCGANQSMNVQQLAGLTSGSRYQAYIGRNPGQTGIAPLYLEYPLDADEIVPMRGSIVTLSLMLQAGSTFSPASGNVRIWLAVGTGAPAKRTSAIYTGETIPIDVTQSITTTPTRYIFTSSVAIPLNTTQASVLVQWTPVGTAGVDDGLRIDDVQLEVGSVATPFERRPFESELSACQRHYYKSFNYDTAPAQNVAAGVLFFGQPTGPSAGFYIYVAYPRPLRVVPTVTLYNPSAPNAQIRCTSINADCSGSTVSANYPNGASLNATSPVGSGLGYADAVQLTADAGI